MATETLLDSPAAGPTAPVPSRRRQSFGAWFREKGWRHLVGVVTTLFAVFPLLYVLSAALNSTGTMAGSNVLFSRIDFGNFEQLFSDPNRPFGRWFYSYVGQQRSENWGVFAAGAVLAALPVMALFLYLQKYIVNGLAAGSVKG